MRQEAKSVYESAASDTLGRVWRFPNQRYHLDDLLALLSDFGPPEANLATGWLDAQVRSWIKSKDDPKDDWHPKRLAEWINRGGKPAVSQLRRHGSGGGPKGDRQGLDGYVPPTGTDFFGGES
jgi:hypothetical protein